MFVLRPRAASSIVLSLALGCGTDGPPPQTPAPLVQVPAPSPSAASPTAPAEPARKEGYTFDGFSLGSSYGAVMRRVPYSTPCDDDPIDHKARRFMIYGAQPCRGRVFPQSTSVMFYLRFSEGADEFDQPIEAFAWLGGDYFSTRSNFPVQTGQPESAARVLGAPLSSFAIERKGLALAVRKHPGHVYSLSEGGTLVGFVVGAMPDDPENEQWRGLMQIYMRYTKPQK